MKIPVLAFLFLQNMDVLCKETYLNGGADFCLWAYLWMPVCNYHWLCAPSQKISLINLLFPPFQQFMKNSPLNYFICFTIRAYQLCISPFFIPSCRFSPSCSNYMAQAVNKYGAYRGVLYSVKRIIKCHPFNDNSGYDPVPWMIRLDILLLEY